MKNFNNFIFEAEEHKVNDYVYCFGIDVSNHYSVNNRVGYLKESLPKPYEGIGMYCIQFPEYYQGSDNSNRMYVSECNFKGISLQEYEHFLNLKNNDKFTLVIFEETLKNDLLIFLGNITFYSDISYIKLDEEENYLTFLPKNSIERVKKEENNNFFENKFRQKMTIGRIMKKLMPYAPDTFIEKCVNYIKMNQHIKKGDTKLEVVEGELIRYWYNEIRYFPGYGSLNGSCMRFSSKSHRFDLYAKNPEVCKMIILSDGTSLYGRALLWKLDHPEGKYFMDRIYVCKDSLTNIFCDYAKKNNYLYRAADDGYKNMMIVKCKNGEYNSPPYMDTFGNVKLNIRNEFSLLYNKNYSNNFSTFEWIKILSEKYDFSI